MSMRILATLIDIYLQQIFINIRHNQRRNSDMFLWECSLDLRYALGKTKQYILILKIKWINFLWKRKRYVSPLNNVLYVENISSLGFCGLRMYIRVLSFPVRIAFGTPISTEKVVYRSDRCSPQHLLRYVKYLWSVRSGITDTMKRSLGKAENNRIPKAI